MSTNGSRIVSYCDLANGGSQVAACTDPACSAATIAALDADLGYFTSITIGSHTNAVVTDHDNSKTDLKVMAYGNTNGENRTAAAADQRPRTRNSPAGPRAQHPHRHALHPPALPGTSLPPRC